MTKRQCMTKIKGMMKDDKNYLITECQRLLKTGGIDIKDEDSESFTKAKAVYYVALLDLLFQRKPVSYESKKDIENLKHF